MKKLLVALALLPLSAYAVSTVTIQHGNGFTETLENYPSADEVLSRALGQQADYRPADFIRNPRLSPQIGYSELRNPVTNSTANYESPALFDAYRHNALGGAILPMCVGPLSRGGAYDWSAASSLATFDGVQDNAWTVAPHDQLAHKRKEFYWPRAWAVRKTDGYKDAAQLYTGLVGNGHLYFLVRPPIREGNRWWDTSAAILVPADIAPATLQANISSPAFASALPTVVRGCLDYRNASVKSVPSEFQTQNLITIYSKEGLGITVVKDAERPLFSYPVMRDREDNGDLARNTGPVRRPMSAFANMLWNNGAPFLGGAFAGPTRPQYESRLARANANKTGTYQELFSTFPENNARGFSTVYDPAQLRAIEAAKAGKLSAHYNEVRVSNPNPLLNIYGEQNSNAKAFTFQTSAVPSDFVFYDSQQAIQAHRFGAYMFTPEWDKFRCNYWQWSTEPPANLHALDREGTYYMVAVPILSKTSGHMDGAGNFVFDKAVSSVVQWDKARVSAYQINGLFEVADLEVGVKAADPRDDIFFNSSTTKKISGVKIYKDDYAHAVRAKYDPSACNMAACVSLRYDKKFAALFNNDAVRPFVKGCVSNPLNPSEKSAYKLLAEYKGDGQGNPDSFAPNYSSVARSVQQILPDPYMTDKVRVRLGFMPIMSGLGAQNIYWDRNWADAAGPWASLSGQPGFRRAGSTRTNARNAGRYDSFADDPDCVTSNALSGGIVSTTTQDGF